MSNLSAFLVKHKVTTVWGNGANFDPPILEEAYRAAVRRPEIVQRLADIGLIVVATSSADFVKVLTEDAARYAEVIRVANVKLE